MRTISTVQCGIKALEEVLNRIVAAVNARTVVAGAGLTSQETPENIVISLAHKDDDHGQQGQQAGGGGGGPAAGTWLTIQAFDQNQNPINITVWTSGVPAYPTAPVWTPVAVLDPSTCAQSTIMVLEKPSS
jgi:nanoRNase/pAp phosphatase (c-di-AMP/oligoRNAs hydrolase)